MNVIKKSRLSEGMSQQELADIIGTYQERVSTWESGEVKPSLEHQKQLKDVLNIDSEELVEELHEVA